MIKTVCRNIREIEPSELSEALFERDYVAWDEPGCLFPGTLHRECEDFSCDISDVFEFEAILDWHVSYETGEVQLDPDTGLEIKGNQIIEIDTGNVIGLFNAAPRLLSYLQEMYKTIPVDAGEDQA